MPDQNNVGQQQNQGFMNILKDALQGFAAGYSGQWQFHPTVMKQKMAQLERETEEHKLNLQMKKAQMQLGQMQLEKFMEEFKTSKQPASSLVTEKTAPEQQMMPPGEPPTMAQVGTGEYGPRMDTPISQIPAQKNIIEILNKKPKKEETPITWQKLIGKGGEETLVPTPSKIKEGSVLPPPIIGGKKPEKQEKKTGIMAEYDEFLKIPGNEKKNIMDFLFERTLVTTREKPEEGDKYIDWGYGQKRNTKTGEIIKVPIKPDTEEKPKKATSNDMEEALSRRYMADGLITGVQKVNDVYKGLQPYQQKAYNKILSLAEKHSHLGAENAINKAVEEYAKTKPFAETQQKTLDEVTAKSILKEAGGDKEKARKIAKNRGYKF